MKNKRIVVSLIITLLCIIFSIILSFSKTHNILISLGEFALSRQLKNPSVWIEKFKKLPLLFISIAIFIDLILIIFPLFMPLLLNLFKNNEISVLNSNTDKKFIKIPDKIEFLISIVLITLIAFIFFINGLNTIQFTSSDFDDAYNATVSANFARYGEYRVSYPDKITYYNIITTGSSVLLPTAIIFKIFGISRITMSIVPLLYGTIDVFLIFFVFVFSFYKNANKYFISLILTFIFLITNTWLSYISTLLLGESAAFCFLLISLLFLIKFYNTRKNKYIFLAGFFLPASFETKSSMIFFVFFFLVLIFLEGFVLKQIEKKQSVIYIKSFFIGFFIFDLFKIIILRSPQKYIVWWVKELINMVGQSTGNSNQILTIKDKVIYLKQIFVGYPIFYCVILICLPVLVYFFYALTVYSQKEKINGSLPVMSIAGLAGTSLLCYFVILGTQGLALARRHCVNEMVVLIFYLYIIGFIFYKIDYFQKIKRQIIFFIFYLGLVFALLVPFKTIRTNIKLYITQYNTLQYDAVLLQDLIKNISDLPENSTLYCYKWWQEPHISLYLDKEIKDISKVIDGIITLDDNSYFIVGQYINDIDMNTLQNKLGKKLVKINNNIVVDYNLYNLHCDKKDFDLFSIYAIQ